MSKALAVRLLRILDNDRPRLYRIDDYLHGNHDDPYVPANADAEYRLLAQRCTSNWTPLLVATPAQCLYVDGFRRGRKAGGQDYAGREVGALDREWDHWQQSRLDARQGSIYRGALSFGHAFTITEKDDKGNIVTRGLSALNTSALFEDPANDIVPAAALTVTKEPSGDQPGIARLFDGRREFTVTFKSYVDDQGVAIKVAKVHPAAECPVTRFAVDVDLEGRTLGVIEPMIPLQNRINQTVFDLLVAQTYGSFKVRTVTGMAPPMQVKAVRDTDGELTGEYEPVLDESGRPVPEKIRVNASRFMFAENENARFSTLDETPLQGYIESIDMSIRHLASVSQTPPHHLLGQIANISAEALAAAEQALTRKVEEYRKQFGEAWERVFRLAAEIDGDQEAATDVHGEVLWRDVEARSMAATSDALLKLRELGIPVRGLMRRVPGVTQTELSSWEEMLDSEPQAVIANRLSTSSGRLAGTTLNPKPLRDEAA